MTSTSEVKGQINSVTGAFHNLGQLLAQITVKED